MAKKLSQIEKAIADLDNRIATLQAARHVLAEVQASAPKRKAKPKMHEGEDPRR